MNNEQINVARLTGEAFQDDETFKLEGGGFVPDRDQLYFMLQQGDARFALGLKDILMCLSVAKKMGEIPSLPAKWWQQMISLYGNDIVMVDRT